jgi:hypothetical protein
MSRERCQPPVFKEIPSLRATCLLEFPSSQILWLSGGKLRSKIIRLTREHFERFEFVVVTRRATAAKGGSVSGSIPCFRNRDESIWLSRMWHGW